MEVGEKKYRLTLVSVEKKYTINCYGYNQLRRIGTFKCECGEEISVDLHLVTGIRGNTRSCGCLRKERALKANTTHGRSKRDHENYRTYSSWQHMKDRCLNPRNKYYKNYGGRGITIDPSWLKFENFLRDMGDSTKGQSIDRVDNEKGYSKENCKWSTFTEQMNNTRRNKLKKQ